MPARLSASLFGSPWGERRRVDLCATSSHRSPVDQANAGIELRQGVEIAENYVHEPLVAVHHLSMRSILSKLIDNAIVGANKAGAGVVRVVV